MRKWFVGCIIIMHCITGVNAQDSYADKVNNYIFKYKALAIQEQSNYGIPASIILAQGIVETEAGLSELATQANNHFGIKCKADWKGQTFAHTDDAPNECFRKYNSAEESYHDHSIYLATTPRYASLFHLPPTDYKAWASGLKKCGYATCATYAQKLVKVIEDFNLQDFTLMAINRTVLKTPVANQEENTTPEQKIVAGEKMKINGLTAIYVYKGETLLKYAVKYNIRYERLLEMNDLPDAPLPCNMYIYLEKKNYRGAHQTHTVKPGETLQQISQLEGIQLRRLMMLNHIPKMGMEPTPGTVLELQKMADTKPDVYYANKNDSTSKIKKTIPKYTQQNLKQNTITQTSEFIYKTTTVTTVPVTTPPPPATTTTNVPVKIISTTNEKITYIDINKNSTTVTEPQAVNKVTTTDKTITTTTPVIQNNNTNVVTQQVAPQPKPVEEQKPVEKDEFTLLKEKLDKVVYENDTKKTTQPTAPQSTIPQPTPQTTISPTTTTQINTTPTEKLLTDNTVVNKDTKEDIKFYIVKKGDTAYTIAKQNKITLRQLMDWNNLDFDDVKEGQRLRVKP